MMQNHVFIVWPFPLDGREHLVPFYRGYARSFMPGTVLHVILKDMKLREGILADMAHAALSCDVVFHEIPDVMDIWIRDWAPVPVMRNGGSTVLVKAAYNPRYIKKKDRRYSTGDDMAGRKLAGILGLAMEEMPLVWDPGNFTRDGYGRAIVSDRILQDNPGYSPDGIRQLFDRFLDITDLAIIPVEPGDETGHLDGTVRFLSHDVLAIGRYPDDHVVENRFMDELEEMLIHKWGDDCRMVHVPHGPVDEHVTEGIASAWGNHLNFFIAGDCLYLPCYRIMQDRQAYRALREAAPGMDIVMVDTEGLDELAGLGGVLNCMTWGLQGMACMPGGTVTISC